jgi:hypothetical protein
MTIAQTLVRAALAVPKLDQTADALAGVINHVALERVPGISRSSACATAASFTDRRPIRSRPSTFAFRANG